MSHIVSSVLSNRSLWRLYLLEFFVSFAVAFPTYVLSSFLSTFMSEAMVGVWYGAGAVLTFVLLALAPRILSRVGNYALAVVSVFFMSVALFEFAYPADPFTVPLFFVAYIALLSLLFFTLDIFFESASKDGETGGIRGFMFVVSNLAFFLAPLLISYILVDGEYGKVFSLSLVIMGIALLLLFPFRAFRDPSYPRARFREALGLTWRNRELRLMFGIRTLLKFSMALITIYAPIYLHEHLGFGWDVVGKLLAFMLLPSLLFNIPAGRLADTRFGEKELLVLGFVTAGVSLSALSFLGAASALLWAGFLFLAYGGTGLINVMVETHFYKRVDVSDAGVISLYKNSNQVAYFLVALSSSALLLFFPLQYIFLTLGLFVLIVGVPLTLGLRDTK